MNLQRPRFDPTLNWGHILTVVTFIVVGFGAWFSVKSDIDRLDLRQSVVERSIDRISTTLQTLAEKAAVDIRQDAQIQSLDRRVDTNERRIDRLTLPPGVIPR